MRVLDELQTDAMFALRLLRRSPGFTSIAILSLALGIGANAAIFSLIDTVLLKSLPVAHPETLFFVDNSGGKSGGSSGPPYPCFELLRDHNRTLAGIAAFDETRFKVAIDGSAEQWRGQYASGNYFDLLGVRAVHGRLLTPADDAIIGQGGADGGAAVISYALWQRRFALDRAVVGRKIQVGTKPVTIVGVTAPEFFGLRVGSPVDITIPMMLAENNLRARSLWWFSVVARLKPNVTREQAQTELHGIWDGYMTEIGERREKRTYFSGIEMVPAARGLAAPRRELSQPLTIAMTIVGLVLLIGCANLANLLLARASARQHELAVRLAIGASRSRLIRQLLTEGFVLAACASLAGVLFAQFGSSFLVRFLLTGDDGLQLLSTAIDGRLLAFTAGIGLLTALLFSLAPAMHATRTDAAKPPGVGATVLTPPRVRLAQSLVLVQVMLAVVLLSGAALFVQTLMNLERVGSGFDREGILTMQIDATMPRSTIAKPTAAESKAHFGQVGNAWSLMQERVAAMPGVRAAAVATLSPLTGRDRGVVIAVSGATLPEQDRSIHVNQVTPGYFEALGTKLLAGRWLTTHDRAGSLRVAILNQTAARTYFGDGNPIGQKVSFPGQRIPDEYEVIGVVGDMRYESLRLPAERMAYLPIEQSLEALASAMLVVRADGDVSGYTNPLRALAAEAVPGGFVTRVATMDSRVQESLVRERLLSILAIFFGALALTLGSIGLYGVMAFSVVRRTREIGIRIAIGARASAVSWMVVRETLVPVMIGVIVGGATAWFGARFVRSQLFGVAPGDPIATSVAVLTLLTVAALAAYVPSRRATRVDPVIALRCE